MDNKASTPPNGKGITISVTAETNAGSRRHMEDYLAVKLCPNEEFRKLPHLKEQAYIGVFDGHGGKEAAKCARERLWDIIQNQPKFKLSDINSIKESLEEAYVALHKEMEPLRVTWKRNKTGDLSTAGTTASTVIFRQDHIFVANVGDSTAILALTNPKADQPDQHPVKALVLTKDHKPEDPNETKNIENLGGRVMTGRKGVPRVVWRRQRKCGKGVYDHIPFLSVSRSLGDFWSFNPRTDRFTVSPKPDVHVYPLNPKEQKFIVIASDGLWNVMSPDEVVHFIWDYEHDEEVYSQPPRDVVKAVINEALRRWERKRLPADNIAVLIAFLSESSEDSSVCSIPQSLAPMAKIEGASEACEVSPVLKINSEVRSSPLALAVSPVESIEPSKLETKAISSSATISDGSSMEFHSITKTNSHHMDRIPPNLHRSPLISTSSSSKLSTIGKHSRAEDGSEESPWLKRTKLDTDSGCDMGFSDETTCVTSGENTDIGNLLMDEDSGKSSDDGASACLDEVTSLPNPAVVCGSPLLPGESS